jgi:hypothetical protein
MSTETIQSDGDILVPSDQVRIEIIRGGVKTGIVQILPEEAPDFALRMLYDHCDAAIKKELGWK